jgi:hypothetical protein
VNITTNRLVVVSFGDLTNQDTTGPDYDAIEVWLKLTAGAHDRIVYCGHTETGFVRRWLNNAGVTTDGTTIVSGEMLTAPHGGRPLLVVTKDPDIATDALQRGAAMVLIGFPQNRPEWRESERYRPRAWASVVEEINAQQWAPMPEDETA